MHKCWPPSQLQYEVTHSYSECLTLAEPSTGGSKLGPLTESLTERMYKGRKTTPYCTVIQLLHSSFRVCLLRYFLYSRGISADTAHQPPSHLMYHVYVFMNFLSFSSQSLPWQIATESPWFLTSLEITFSLFVKVSSLENSSSPHKH